MPTETSERLTIDGSVHRRFRPGLGRKGAAYRQHVVEDTAAHL